MILLALALAMPQQSLPQTVQAHCGPNGGTGSIGITTCLVTCPASYTLKPGTMTCELDKPPSPFPTALIFNLESQGLLALYSAPGKLILQCSQTNKDLSVADCKLEPGATLEDVLSAILKSDRQDSIFKPYDELAELRWQVAELLADNQSLRELLISRSATWSTALPQGPYRVHHKTFSCKRHPEKCRICDPTKHPYGCKAR